MTSDGSTHVKFVALKDIIKDEEITYNYNGFGLEWRSKRRTG